MNWKNGQTRIGFWLPETLKQRVEQAAAADHRKVSDFIRIAIDAACARTEEQASNKPLEDRKNA